MPPVYWPIHRRKMCTPMLWLCYVLPWWTMTNPTIFEYSLQRLVLLFLFIDFHKPYTLDCENHNQKKSWRNLRADLKQRTAIKMGNCSYLYATWIWPNGKSTLRPREKWMQKCSSFEFIRFWRINTLLRQFWESIKQLSIRAYSQWHQQYFSFAKFGVRRLILCLLFGGSQHFFVSIGRLFCHSFNPSVWVDRKRSTFHLFWNLLSIGYTNETIGAQMSEFTIFGSKEPRRGKRRRRRMELLAHSISSHHQFWCTFNFVLFCSVQFFFFVESEVREEEKTVKSK